MPGAPGPDQGPRSWAAGRSRRRRSVSGSLSTTAELPDWSRRRRDRPCLAC